ncbi:response regulator [Phreatobacter aquaticus]|uniref:Response regulator n=1 Tax=Phreatobacter aquaticus TaxID=2570229 RepID=A0A4D7QLM6_9HYPH|nr:response regulator [Phreatobacter aquaticus]QCK88508.1 response regulator [Phreatobacter aquaticus]
MSIKAEILVVDDVEAVRASLFEALSAAGYAPTCVGSGSDALAALAHKRFAVAVTDIWMADIDGLKLIKMIRESNRDLPILAMTGGGPRLTIETAGSLAEVWGAERVFVKPFDEDLLIQTIDAIVAKQPH